MSKEQTAQVKSFRRKTPYSVIYFPSIDQPGHSAHLLLLQKEDIRSLFESFTTSYNTGLDETKADASLSETKSRYLTIYQAYLQRSSCRSTDFYKFQNCTTFHE